MNFVVLILSYKTFFILLRQSDAKVKDSKPECLLGLNDFSRIVNTTAFIDKTMLIQELFSHNIVFLTAPSGFGKSTSLDMVKRFLQIEVNEAGTPKDIRTTANYNLFVQNNLNIVKNEQFFNEHFGKHPVIYIDFRNLSGITSFDSMLKKLGQIQRNTFLQHKYLLKNTELWIDGEDKELFYTYTHRNHTRLSERKIRSGFKWLSELLCERFNKRVFVLIDKFDTFLCNLPHTTNQHKVRIFGFFRYMNSEMFKHNDDNIDRALLMGDSIEKDIDVYPDNIRKDSVLYDQYFWKYYGVTEKEMHNLLTKVTSDEEERVRLKRSFEEYEGKIKIYFEKKQFWRQYRYCSEPPFYKLYSFRPIIKFLQQKRESL